MKREQRAWRWGPWRVEISNERQYPPPPWRTPQFWLALAGIALAAIALVMIG